jgi:hypothetical protein
VGDAGPAAWGPILIRKRDQRDWARKGEECIAARMHPFSSQVTHVPLAVSVGAAVEAAKSASAAEPTTGISRTSRISEFPEFPVLALTESTS